MDRLMEFAALKPTQTGNWKDKTPVKYTKTEEGILLQLGQVPTDIDHVLEITWK